MFFFTSNNDVKACVAEILNRTLKTRMFKYFTFKNTRKYLDVLPKLLEGYNNKVHSSTGFAPSQIGKHNFLQAYKNMFGKEKKPSASFRFSVGDKVRISKAKMIFEKGYEQNWTLEIFVIKRRLKRTPVVYKLEDMNGEELDSIFYENELQKVFVSDDKEYEIEKILEKKGKMVKVKFLGYPDSFNSWIPSSNIVSLK